MTFGILLPFMHLRRHPKIATMQQVALEKRLGIEEFASVAYQRIVGTDASFEHQHEEDELLLVFSGAYRVTPNDQAEIYATQEQNIAVIPGDSLHADHMGAELEEAIEQTLCQDMLADWLSFKPKKQYKHIFSTRTTGDYGNRESTDQNMEEPTALGESTIIHGYKDKQTGHRVNFSYGGATYAKSLRPHARWVVKEPRRIIYGAGPFNLNQFDATQFGAITPIAKNMFEAAKQLQLRIL